MRESSRANRPVGARGAERDDGLKEGAGLAAYAAFRSAGAH